MDITWLHEIQLIKRRLKEKTTGLKVCGFLQQNTGVEPASSAWEADILPMY